jgi:hypothetical protein
MSERHCCKCKQPGGKGSRELRPYGPNGADLCAGCVFGENGKKPNKELLSQIEKQFDKQMAMVGDSVAVIDPTEQAGPRPPTTEEQKRLKRRGKPGVPS